MITFIDVGCSGGLPFPFSEDDEISVVGFDISDSSIAYLSKKYPLNLYLHASIGLEADQDLTLELEVKSDYRISTSQAYVACHFLENLPSTPMSVSAYKNLLLNSKEPLTSSFSSDVEFEATAFISYYKRLFSSSPIVSSSHTSSPLRTSSLDSLLIIDNPAILKVDTDGTELDVLKSFNNGFNSSNVLCVIVECQMRGLLTENASTFANIDTFLRTFNFLLADLEPIKYRSAFLPSFFLTSEPAETLDGIVQFANTVYIQSPSYFVSSTNSSNVTDRFNAYFYVCSKTNHHDLFLEALALAKCWFDDRAYLDWADSISLSLYNLTYSELVSAFTCSPKSFYINSPPRSTTLRFLERSKAFLSRKFSSNIPLLSDHLKNVL